MKRNKFSLSNFHLLTCNLGKLVPINWFEVIPGDTVQQATGMLLRFSPLLAPIMHPIRVRIHHWFVPYRLVWEDFEDFMTGDDTPTLPYFSSTGAAESSIEDYMGIGVGSFTSDQFNILPFRAYNLIWNEFYADQDIHTPAALAVTSGADATTDIALQRCSWGKDYFTTSRPWPQKGATVTIPVSSGTPDYVTIEDLRLGQALYRYQEARARYGSRYVEYLRSLGIRPSDARLANPEYLAGGTQTVQFSEVLQTAEGTEFVGSMKGHGLAALRTNRYRRFFEEHGIVMSLMSAIPRHMLDQAQDRFFFKTVKEDFYTKELSGLDDQEITYKEVYCDHSTPDSVFAYQRRYDEYRTSKDNVSGEFHSTMDHWHLARIFSSDVALNESFLNCNPDNRIFANTADDKLHVMVNNSIQARRPVAR